MLNQFIQICIPIRNAGGVATGCLIYGLAVVVDGFLGHTALFDYRAHWSLQLDCGSSRWGLQPDDRGRFLRFQPGYQFRTSWYCLQG